MEDKSWGISGAFPPFFPPQVDFLSSASNSIERNGVGMGIAVSVSAWTGAEAANISVGLMTATSAPLDKHSDDPGPHVHVADKATTTGRCAMRDV